ncbi:MAG: hypothetical protein U0166_06820 [Acidobacteriota bacterium]
MTAAARRDAALCLLTAAFAFAVCLHYGRIGYHPVDHSIVFDGAWRCLSGQLPFRDYQTPSAVTPILMQAAFFRLLGVTWLSYCLHAALVNGAFAALVHGLLRVLGASPLAATLGALGSGIAFYPVQGVPFMDQHAFFFTAAAVALPCFALRAPPAARAALLFATPAALAFGYASKQIPTVFALPAIAILWAAWMPARTRSLVTLGAGGAAVIVAVAALIAALGIPFDRFWYDYQTLPMLHGKLRSTSEGIGPSLASTARVLWHLGLASLALLVAATVAWLAGAARDVVLLAARRAPPRVLGPAGLVASWLTVVTLLFVRLTNNEPEEGLAFVPAALALFWVEVRRVAGPSRVSSVAGILLAVAGSWDAVAFTSRVVAPRRALSATLSADEGSRSLPEALSFLRYRVPAEYRDASAESLGNVVAFFRDHPGNFMLVGDSSILYGLTGRPSVGNSLWFHPGLTAPPRNTDAFARYLRELDARLAAFSVRFVVLEGRRTWMKVDVSLLPPVHDLVATRGREAATYGPFRIIEIVPPAGER